MSLGGSAVFTMSLNAFSGCCNVDCNGGSTSDSTCGCNDGCSGGCINGCTGYCAGESNGGSTGGSLNCLTGGSKGASSCDVACVGVIGDFLL